MNKKYLLVFPVVLLLVVMVFAMSSFTGYPKRLNVVEKNPNDWTVVEGGAHGEVVFSFVSSHGKIRSQRVMASAWGLEPKTKYTLIYYGYEEYNDKWANATCIKNGKTSSKGYVRMLSGNFDWMSFTDDQIEQKFWIVKSSDIDCKNHKMIAWHPTAYLFETETI